MWVFSMKEIYITLNQEQERRDMWNSSDESHFFIVKGEVKRLPNKITTAMLNAMEQGIIREATEQEVKDNYKE